MAGPIIIERDELFEEVQPGCTFYYRPTFEGVEDGALYILQKYQTETLLSVSFKYEDGVVEVPDDINVPIDNVTSFIVLPDNMFVFGTADGKIKLFKQEEEDGDLVFIKSIDAHPVAVENIFPIDKSFFSVGANGSLMYFSWKNGGSYCQRTIPHPPITAAVTVDLVNDDAQVFAIAGEMLQVYTFKYDESTQQPKIEYEDMSYLDAAAVDIVVDYRDNCVNCLLNNANTQRYWLGLQNEFPRFSLLGESMLFGLSAEPIVSGVWLDEISSLCLYSTAQGTELRLQRYDRSFTHKEVDFSENVTHLGFGALAQQVKMQNGSINFCYVGLPYRTDESTYTIKEVSIDYDLLNASGDSEDEDNVEDEEDSEPEIPEEERFGWESGAGVKRGRTEMSEDVIKTMQLECEWLADPDNDEKRRKYREARANLSQLDEGYFRTQHGQHCLISFEKLFNDEDPSKHEYSFANGPVVVLDCGHAFLKEELQKWRDEGRRWKCPICNAPLKRTRALAIFDLLSI